MSGRSGLHQEVQQAGTGGNLSSGIGLGKSNYSFIKNTIQLVAEDLGDASYNTAVNDERNKDAFVMGAESMDIERLLSHSQSLAQGKGRGGGK